MESVRAASNERRTLDPLLLRGPGEGSELGLVRQNFPEMGHPLVEKDGVQVEATGT